MSFKSDNIGPISSEIMQAIIEANHGIQSSYGSDDYTLDLQNRMSEIFETNVIVYLTSTGTAANSLALSSMVEPYEAIYCINESHIHTDECGAPEFFTGGSKLIIVDSDVNGKININSLNEKISLSLSLRPHGQKPGCISITQATECGTVYTVDELTDINNIAKKYNMSFHMDGARFSNSLISLNCSPAEVTWKAGVDVLSFGATKNGAMCAEAVVFFNHDYAKNFDYLHKRSGQLMSKSRFFSCQFLAYLKDDLWIKNAKKANLMSEQLSEIFRKHNIEIMYPNESNEVFVKLSDKCVKHLENNNFGFYDWATSNIKTELYRFVTSCFTSNDDLIAIDDCLNDYYNNIKS